MGINNSIRKQDYIIAVPPNLCCGLLACQLSSESTVRICACCTILTSPATTALHFVVEKSIVVCQRLLDLDANIIAQTKDSKTPLITVAVNYIVDIVKYLLSKGADTSIKISSDSRFSIICKIILRYSLFSNLTLLTTRSHALLRR